jgi:HAD superfamily hydrolase (TIGR01490 family)
VTARRVGAFFDIDHTVLEINSGSRWIGYMWRTGQMGLLEVARALKWLAQYRFGLLDYEAMATRVLAGYAGREVAPLADEIQRWFHDDVAWAICTEARARIERHREAGDVLVLLTSATQFLTRPVAEALDIEHMLCTRVEVDGGQFTGRYAAPACYGQGKVHHAESFAAAQDIDLAASYFYSDSYSDLPMLERVGQPRVVNPDPRLRKLARGRGWSIETWTAPPRDGAKTTKVQHVGS